MSVTNSTYGTNVHEIADGSSNLAVMKQMCSRVHDDVGGGQYSHAVGERLGLLEQAIRRRLETTGARQDPVVHVDDRTALAMDHWREFVHPLAVVPIVVSIDLGEFPAMLLKDLFDPSEIRSRHEHIDVGDAPAASRRQSRSDVSGAFQQNPRLTGIEECAAQTIDFPTHGAFVAARQRFRGHESIAQPFRPHGRDVAAAHLFHEPTKQPRALRGIERAAECLWRQPIDGRRVAEHARQYFVVGRDVDVGHAGGSARRQRLQPDQHIVEVAVF